MELRPSSLVVGFLRGVERVVGGVQDRVVAVQLGRVEPREKTTAVDVSQAGRPQGPTWWDQQAVEVGRLERYRDYREGRAEMPEWDRALQVRKAYCFSAQVGENGRPLSFRLSFAPNARDEVVSACESLTERLDLHAAAPDIYDAGQWLGDSFEETIYEPKSRAMVDLRHWEPERVAVRTSAATGRVDGYAVATADNPYAGAPGAEQGVNVPPFLMAHYAPGKVRGGIYGRSLFYAGRKGRREYEGVNDMLVMAAMQAMASQFLLWPFPREQKASDIWRWVNDVKAGAELNLAFTKDGVLRRRLAKMVDTSPRVLPYMVDPELKDPPTVFNATTANLDALLKVAQWQQENAFVTTGVPAVLCGVERNVNSRATATEQSAQFAVSIMSDQTDFAQDVLAPIYLRQLLALGIVPEPGEVKIEMFPPSQLYERMRADVAKAQGEAAKVMVEAGIPLPFALAHAFGLSPVETVEILGVAAPAGRPDASTEAVEAFVAAAIDAAAERHGARPVAVDVAGVERVAVAGL